LHGIFWVVLSKKSIRKIKIGFKIKYLMPYANFIEPMNAFSYKFRVVAPGLLMGLIPYILGLICNNEYMTIFGIFFTLVASGDLLVLWKLRRIKGSAIVEGHPKNVGCFVYKP
jgi:hypothetical protein